MMMMIELAVQKHDFCACVFTVHIKIDGLHRSRYKWHKHRFQPVQRYLTEKKPFE